MLNTLEVAGQLPLEAIFGASLSSLAYEPSYYTVRMYDLLCPCPGESEPWIGHNKDKPSKNTISAIKHICHITSWYES